VLPAYERCIAAMKAGADGLRRSKPTNLSGFLVELMLSPL